MSETRYRLSIANVPISIPQGVTYYQRWQMRYKASGLPFPFFSDLGVALWKGRCMFRLEYDDAAPLLSLTTEDGGVVLDYIDDVDPLIPRQSFYSLVATATQTAALPAGKLYYDVEFERLTDGWVIRPQRGRATVGPEVTK